MYLNRFLPNRTSHPCTNTSSERDYSTPAYVTVTLTCPKGRKCLRLYVDNLTAVIVKGM